MVRRRGRLFYSDLIRPDELTDGKKKRFLSEPGDTGGSKTRFLPSGGIGGPVTIGGGGRRQEAAANEAKALNFIRVLLACKICFGGGGCSRLG